VTLTGFKLANSKTADGYLQFTAKVELKLLDKFAERAVVELYFAFPENVEQIDPIFLPCQEAIAATDSINYIDYTSTTCSADIAYCGDEKTIVIPDIDPYAGVEVNALRNNGITDNYFSTVEKIIIPEHISTIDTHAFNKCENLQEFVVADGNECFKVIDGNLYSKDGKTLIKYAQGKPDLEFTVPDGVETIEEFAFVGSHLESLSIPKTVIAIKDSDNVAIKELLELPFYSYTAFGNSTGLLQLICPAKLLDATPIGGVQKLTILGTDGDDTICEGCLKDNTSLLEVMIDDAVEVIDEGAFESCVNLNSVVLGNNIKTICDAAFSNCAITTINLPDSLTTLSGSPFHNCQSLKTVVMGNNVSNFNPVTCFADCVSLEYISVHEIEGVSSYYSKQGCIYDEDHNLLFYPSGRSEIQFNVPNEVKKIGSNAFTAVAGLRTIVLPEGLLELGDTADSSAFKNLMLDELVIPDSFNTKLVLTDDCKIKKLSLTANTLLQADQAKIIDVEHLVVRHLTPANIYKSGTKITFAANNLKILEFEADFETEADEYTENSELPDLTELVNLNTLIIHNRKDRMPNFPSGGSPFPTSINMGGQLEHIYVPYDCELFYESTWQSQGAAMLEDENNPSADLLADIIKEYEEVASKDWLMDQLLYNTATDADIANLFII
jgi:hypothetical protein